MEPIAVLSVLVVIAGAAIDHYSTKIAENSIVMDALGRQRVLIQAMGKAALLNVSSNEYETAKNIFTQTLQAAKGASEITENINGVAQAASDTSQGIGQTHSAATELEKMAADLQNLVGQFKY